MPETNIGINKMIITSPGLYIKPEEIAKPITAQDVQAKLKREQAAAKKDGKEWKTPSPDEIGKMVQATIPDTVGKIRKGLGVETIRMVGHSESNATFVADAIYEFIKGIANDKEALAKLRAEPVKSIYYATESNPDRSRPELEPAMLIATSKLIEDDEKKYREVIEMFKKAEVVPITYACVGGVIALHKAVTGVRMASLSGSPESAVVVSADTAYYDSKKAPGAEATQGAAAALMWITRDPKLVAVGDRKGNYHMTLSDFTKFIDETPEVHGKFSEMVYVYTVGRALESLELELGHGGKRDAKMFNELDFFICHVPFPKQAEYLASFLFVHWIKNHDKKLYDDIQMRDGVGNEPLKGFSHLTDLMESKFRIFNSDNGDTRHEQAIIKHIEDDPDIRAYWDWLKLVRKAPEFEKFLEGLHIRDALKIPSSVGNSYSNSIFVSMASLMRNVFGKMPAGSAEGGLGVMAGYGSGAQAMAYLITILARGKTVDDHLLVTLGEDKKWALTSEQYGQLHDAHIRGDSVRLTGGNDLIELDKSFLRSGTLPKGFHVKRRNPDGTGEYVYSDGNMIVPVRIRY